MSRGLLAWGARVAAALLVAAFLVGPGPHDLPANAEPVPPPNSLSVNARDTVAVVSWEHTEATGYLVEYTVHPSFATVERTTVSRDLAVLDALVPATTYYLRVTALSPDGAVGSPSVPISFTTRNAGFPLAAPVLSVDSPSSTSLNPRWVADGDDLNYQVELLPHQSSEQVRSKTVQAEQAVFDKLEPGTDYSVRVRVVDDEGRPLSDWSAMLSRRTAEYLPLKVATYNIQKWTQNNWSKRRPALVSTIHDQDPDVVGLQEATPARVPGGRRQYADLLARLGPDWAITEAVGRASGEVRTIYNQQRLDLVSHGQHALTGSTRFGVQRYATWAIFEQKNTGKRFVFVNTHFIYQNNASADRWRTSATRQLVQMVERVNPDGLPVVIVGDFNSGALRNSGNGVYRTITAAGYLDPLAGTDKLGAAENRVRSELKTVNGYRRKAPVDRTAPMIDHVFVSKMRVAEWETVARLDRSGRFIGTIPSDHNMVRATVYLP